MKRRAFSLVELLVVVAVIALLISVLLPSLAGARSTARAATCVANQRQLGLGWSLYANCYQDRAMPLAYWSAQDIGTGPQVFWWGTHGTSATPPDHSRGFIAPFLDASLAARSVFECPDQPWGSYRPQGPSRTVTSTYGYNGYYLSPAKTPGWGEAIGFRPWRRVSSVDRPCEVLVFADTLLPGSTPSNTALLDPPFLFDGGEWIANDSPTTAFRHRATRAAPGAAAGVRADGSARSTRADIAWIADESAWIGSIGPGNDPAYVPDWRQWSQHAAGRR